MLDLTTLIPRCHNAAKANGWWDTPNPKPVSLMLVISELAEAMEADRAGKRADLASFDLYYNADAKRRGGEMSSYFRDFIKDTFEDEIADAIIRLCDLAGGWGIDPEAYEAEVNDVRNGRLTAGNQPIATVLFYATHRITRSLKDDDEHNEVMMGEAVAVLVALCKREGIDLARHIDLKLEYNATRGHKHGDKAY